ncbi:MAG TPA: membrane dipeptidase [Clostridiaceae bacterium]|nr:membrane dipeptidase [Clostridiaceae bacterium]
MNVSMSEKIHSKAVVIDSLAFPYILEDQYFANVKKGGVDAAVITAAISNGFKDTVLQISKILKRIAERKDFFCLATSAEEILEAKIRNKFAVILGFQDIAPLEGDLTLIDTYRSLGVRIMQLTYTGGNMAGDGCGERTDCGLRYFGLEAIEEMNRLGIVVDLSHTGDATTEEAIRYSKSPVMFTHSNCRALCDNKRNKTDEQIKALASKGGYMGLTPHPALVCKGRSPDLDAFLDHVDHIVKLVGVDHVGIGLDYVEGLKEEGKTPESVRLWRTRRPDIFGTVDDFFNVSFTKDIDCIEKLPNFTRGLLTRGYSETDIEKILGGNFLRVFKDITGQ